MRVNMMREVWYTAGSEENVSWWTKRGVTKVMIGLLRMYKANQCWVILNNDGGTITDGKARSAEVVDNDSHGKQGWECCGCTVWTRWWKVWTTMGLLNTEVWRLTERGTALRMSRGGGRGKGCTCLKEDGTRAKNLTEVSKRASKDGCLFFCRFLGREAGPEEGERSEGRGVGVQRKVRKKRECTETRDVTLAGGGVL